MNNTRSKMSAMLCENVDMLVTMSAITMTVLSGIALVVNSYLLYCSRYLRRPIGINLRLCVSLTASDALCAICYILTYLVNIFFNHFSNCASLLLEVFKLTTFTASVFTLLFLALTHYVGIVHPLYRNAITNRSVKCAITFSYAVPFALYLGIFSLFPGGLFAPEAFSFLDGEGCKGNQIYRNSAFRFSLVAPFIFFVCLLSALYMHILFHMHQLSRDPLLKNSKSKRNNRKLLTTIMLLAGSACIGWLPTSVNFVLPIFVQIDPNARLVLGIIAQTLHVSKLIADAFVYASRLVEIRYSM
ncbi:unnamed protein product [Caenorhabditis bovis]|uniref:G-protein coupled receptors family 1 profile domain-containing protein n=1 Tax=Caenorhabditis bovis TaxID=2654633 RepID=A0A8S1EM98_9PELO|nr:unnamed protein product [Caenorhabditis bovis]